VKIVGIEDFPVDAGWANYCFLKITTDEGIVGWGEYNEARGRTGLTGLVRNLGTSLIGTDPRDVNLIDAKLYAQSRSTAGGLQSHAIAPIVNACLDIKAKALGVPVYEMLGGAVRKRIPVYWSHCALFRAREAMFGTVIDSPPVHNLNDIRALGREVRERGFKALKTNLLITQGDRMRSYVPGTGAGSLGGFPELNVSDAIVGALVDQLAAFRDGAGLGVKLMVDLNFHYKPDGYKRLAKEVEPFKLLWLEFDLYEPVALRMIRESTSTPIGSLEAILGRRNFRPYLEERSVDAAIIDVQWNGLPEALRMASMADGYDVNVAAHNSSGPLSTVISAHFSAMVPNLKIMELDVDEVPWRPQLLTNPYKVEAGEFLLPTGVGWGTDIDEDVARAHRATKSEA
jgi:L-alanine-DL-glutamate epimerase-like enolase superfamily enzyme